MRWYKIILLLTFILFILYSASMYFVEDSKELVLEKNIQYPVEKVFLQFDNLQDFTRWNDYFSNDKDMAISYFTPYEGIGSSIAFKNSKNSLKSGELYLRYVNPNKTIRYQLFLEPYEKPFLIDIKFKKTSENSTHLVWKIHTPQQSYFKRPLNLIIDNFTEENISKSMNNLSALLSNKVLKDQQLANIKYDSIMSENIPTQLLLGVNVSANNKKDNLIKNIIMNHNKVTNFVKLDLGKKEDEYGLPVMIIPPNELKNKEISYFYGIPISKKVSVSDNSFSFRTQNATQAFVIYYKGNFAGRTKAIQQLMQKAKSENMRNGDIVESFVETPEEGKDCMMKIILPVYH